MQQIEFIYGTAWKEEQTGDLVEAALDAGYLAIDTANQKKHYREDYMGKRLKKLFDKGLNRSKLFLQSKYTYQQGQDHRLPYNENDTYTEQVKSSFASSLINLNTDYLDSYLLHGPLYQNQIGSEDIEVWHAMEELALNDQVKSIGLSNVSIHHLEDLFSNARVKPSFVQNRCYASRSWDIEVLEFCKKHNIKYQGFSLLTANQEVWSSEKINKIASKYSVTPANVIYRFAQQIGMIPLTGTTNFDRMKNNLNLTKSFKLTNDEITIIKNFSI